MYSTTAYAPLILLHLLEQLPVGRGIIPNQRVVNEHMILLQKLTIKAGRSVEAWMSMTSLMRMERQRWMMGKRLSCCTCRIEAALRDYVDISHWKGLG